jgi:hypothetical protein
VETLVPVLAVLGFLTLITLIIVLSLHLQKRRTEALARLATTLGLHFAVDAEPGFLESFNSLHLFTLGRRGSLRNLLRGDLGGVAVCLFDYSYVTGSGKHRTTHRQTVVGLSMPSLSLPGFNLRPENLLHKLGSALGYQDIDFAEVPGFSSRYLLRGTEEGAIRAAFGRQVLSYLEQRTGISAEGAEHRLIYYRAGKILPPQTLRTFIEEGRQLAILLAQQAR